MISITKTQPITEMHGKAFPQICLAKPCLTLHKIGKHRLQLILIDLLGKQHDGMGHGAILRPHDIGTRRCPERVLFCVISKTCPRGDAGLDREAAKNGLAEGMHGLNAWPVIIIENLGKETASSGNHLLRRREQSHAGKIAAKINCWDNGPLCEPAGNPVPHFGRRRTRVGHT